MDRDPLILKAVASAPGGVCVCCLVDQCGLKHDYVLATANRLRNEGCLRALDLSALMPHLRDKRKRAPMENCSSCKKAVEPGNLYYISRFTGLCVIAAGAAGGRSDTSGKLT